MCYLSHKNDGDRFRFCYNLQLLATKASKEIFFPSFWTISYLIFLKYLHDLHKIFCCIIFTNIMLQHMCDCSCAQCSFPHPWDSHYDSVDEKGLHPYFTKTAQYEETCLWKGSSQVNLYKRFVPYSLLVLFLKKLLCSI